MSSNQLDKMFEDAIKEQEEGLRKYYQGFAYKPRKCYYFSDLTWWQRLWDWIRNVIK